jgi:ligand-binding sensor domain-containing protein
MKYFATILCMAIAFCTNGQNPLSGIGQWRTHFDNHSFHQVLKGDAIYTASPYQIFRLQGDKSYSIDKSNGLSDIGIQQIAWDQNEQQLVVIYNSSNIDFVKEGQVFNLNSIELSTLYPDRKINAFHIYNQWGFAATNFGIVVIDLIQHEIKETWFPNNNQQSTKTNDLVIARDSLFALTNNGLWAAAIGLSNPSIGKWAPILTYQNHSLKYITQSKGQIYLGNNNALFQYPHTSPIYQNTNAIISSIDTSVNQLMIGIRYPTQKGQLVQINPNSASIIIDSNILSYPKQSLVIGNEYWIADSIKGLLYKNNTSFAWRDISGLKATVKGTSAINEKTLVAPYGNTSNGFAKLDESGWQHITNDGGAPIPMLQNAAVSNVDDSYWFTNNNSFVRLVNNKVEMIRPNNLVGDFKQLQIDPTNTLWAIQDQQGLVKYSNGNWTSIAIPTGFSKNGLDRFVLNNQGQAWIIAPNRTGIYLYQSNTFFSNEMWKQLGTNSNNGNLPSTNVTSIANDLKGTVWVGTDNGIGIFNCGDIASAPCNAYLPIVNNNGFNGYLFQRETVNCISVDGANRKWIGTNNGAWLLSEDGLTIVNHFTKTNSPLPSDTIVQILIQPKSGEVFINTNNQMVSYRGTATAGTAFQNTIQIFPNPVSSNFNGSVAIRGLVDNAIVKITDLSGKLLYQTNALGGQALWNVRNIDGYKMASGIYLVFVRDLTGNEKAVGKIVIADGY